MKGVDALDALLEKEINPELFVRDGKSLVFYLYLWKRTEELQEKRNKLAALVRAGGGKAITSNKAKGADYRIRVERDAATVVKDAGKEWLDPRFIVECVEAGKLLDSAEYVITPVTFVPIQKALEEFEFERVMAPEEAAPYVEQEMLARELLKTLKNKQLFTRKGKSLVFHLLVSTGRNTKELQSLVMVLRELVRAGGGRTTNKGQADFRIRVERDAPTNPQFEGIEWIETEFILDSVESNVLFNSRDYVVVPDVRSAKNREEDVVFEEMGAVKREREEEIVVKREREEEGEISLPIKKKPH